ncbi:hypothetical protein B0H15DRAFT_776143 [Mycena belliarum]|uniref:Uncharacterized protein n=1 Tax=Mycena belliarum TaxID=1033014 RepID=A0AAD6U7U2_9AGAR|nr:hypothetical protein B0H15DRAFT_776143 [Mycena belliae]
MFVFGMTRDGARGLEATENASEPEAEDMTPEELAGYGVDYEAQGNPRLMDHLLEHNPQEWENENPFLAGSAPDKFTTVICDPPGCPLSLAQRDRLDLFLLQRVDATSRDMNVRKLIWIEALRICQELTSA